METLQALCARQMNRAASLAQVVARLTARRPPAMVVGGVVIGAALATVVAVGVGVADYDPITDLPFWGTYRLTCGWHINCLNPGYDPDRGGIDIGLPLDTLVVAGGDGRVVSGGSEGAWGYAVRIDHSGEESLSAHLNWYFLTGGERICRHVAIGYSGSTGSSSGPHLHFGGEDKPDQFDPIHGVRPSTYDNATFQYDPDAVPPQPTRMLSHQGVATNAWTVDDIALNKEFFLHGSTGPGGWQLESGNGFGYGGKGAATYYWVPTSTEGWTHWATWDPILKVAGEWDVYVFVPSENATTEYAHYQVGWVSGGQWHYTDIYVDQSSIDNEWVRLQNAQHESFPTEAPGQWRLSVRVFNDCRTTAGCAGRKVAADAAMFVPADCGP